MNTDTEETLNKVHGLIKDDQERTRRFNHLMDKLNVPKDNGLALTAAEQLSSEQKQQTEQDLVLIFQQMGELSASGNDLTNIAILNKQDSHIPINKDLKAKKPQRPIRMRGLTI